MVSRATEAGMSRRARLPAAKVQAASFDRMRTDHRTEVAEDYVELIADLIAAKGEARTVDLADRLGVAPATVNSQIAKLARAGLVESAPYRAIFLTEEGERLAEFAKARHRTVVQFLMAIGVDEATAHQDAEGIEHHVSDATLQAMARFLDER
jgi:DtxR family manganese transport transcriptional regulator